MNIEINSDIRGVIFDLGSTLLEYENIPWDNLNLTCLHSGYEYLRKNQLKIPSFEDVSRIYVDIRQKYRDAAAQTFEEWIITDAIGELMSAIGLSGEQKLSEQFFDAYYKPVQKQLTLFADTAAVMQRIKKSGLKVGLVSNTIFPEKYHIKELNKFHLTDYFDFKIFSSSFGYRKPHPLIYRKAIELSENPAEKLIFVGDRYLEDYLGPRENGIFSILKYREGREYPDPMPPDLFVIKSLSELIPILSNQIDDNI